MSKENTTDLDRRAVASLRTIAMEEIDRAHSGHPGGALDSAPLLYVLYTEFLKASCADASWFNRDRFILGAGHVSSIYYALLSSLGYGLTKEDLMAFRQLGSRTPGHPEEGVTPGVDMSSGPLGQGVPEAVGMQIAENYLAQYFNRAGFPIVSHKTYVYIGDGDMQEGITQEAFSLAGHLAVPGLVVLYDSNGIQLDSTVALVNTEDTEAKMHAMDWDYLYVADGNDLAQVRAAFRASEEATRPLLIEFSNVIGIGTSLAGTNKVHGAPIPHEETLSMRAALGGEPFTMADDVARHIRNKASRLAKAREEWQELFTRYEAAYPALARRLTQALSGEDVLDPTKFTFPSDEHRATRYAFGDLFKEASREDPLFIGGAADLSSSTQGSVEGGVYSRGARDGRNIYFGVREDSMTSITNGIAMHKGLRAFCSGFFVFTDYQKPAIRMAALMHLPIIGMFSHDSIAVGEDGPTHQPIEQLTMLRSIPGVNVIRPCDAFEAAEAFQIAYASTDTPTMLIATRQVTVPLTEGRARVARGAYVLVPEEGPLEGIFIANGSEVALAVEAARVLTREGHGIRVVSMPSTYLFDRESAEYRESVLPLSCRKRVAIEMSEASYYAKYVGLDGTIVGMTTFGTSGPFKDVMAHFGFTAPAIVEAYKRLK